MLSFVPMLLTLGFCESSQFSQSVALASANRFSRWHGCRRAGTVFTASVFFFFFFFFFENVFSCLLLLFVFWQGTEGVCVCIGGVESS